MSTKKQVLYSILVLALAAGLVGFYRVRSAPPEQAGGMKGHDHAAMAGGGGERSQLNPVKVTATAARTIGVTYAPVTRRPLASEVRTVGTVQYDETRLANLSPKIEGWVEKLNVDFTGAPVRKGEAMLEVYSPVLVAAQEELILARKLADGATDGRAKRNADDLLASARRRLAYWDIPASEIAAVEKSGEARKTLTLRAPASGIVVEKNVVEGARIMPGMEVFRIADLSRVWVEGEVFEKDLSLATKGQPATVTFQSYPGEAFQGTVTYVYPSVSMESRTGRVRVELANPDLRLRPGMYAEIRLQVASPRVALTVPRAAVLFTGERAVVFVRHPDGTLMPQDVVTGLVAGNDIEIVSGLEEGQQVVTSASFLIDAESNLGASMGSMPGMDMGAPGAEDDAAPAMDMSGSADQSGHTGHE